jgi:hypothetical protein
VYDYLGTSTRHYTLKQFWVRKDNDEAAIRQQVISRYSDLSIFPSSLLVEL